MQARSLRTGWKNRVRGVRGHDLMSALEGGLAGQGDSDPGGQGGWRELIRASARVNRG